MSDREVEAVLDQMEVWLQPELFLEGPETLREWNHQFAEAVRTAERGSGWPALVERAHAMAVLIQARLQRLEASRAALKVQMGLQAQGLRALKGYQQVVR